MGWHQCEGTWPERFHHRHPSVHLGLGRAALLLVVFGSFALFLSEQQKVLQRQPQQQHTQASFPRRHLVSFEDGQNNQLEGEGFDGEWGSSLSAGSAARRSSPTSRAALGEVAFIAHEEEEEIGPLGNQQQQQVGRTRDPSLVFTDGGDSPPVVGEARAIQPINIPFLQEPGKFRMPGNGISLEAQGEPKSGTTWFGRLVPQLALELCGSYNNLWCEMGGLVVGENLPAPSYDFEMLNTSNRGQGENGTQELFLHFKGKPKHIIPGMDVRPEHSSCHNGGIMHVNNFEDDPPCVSGEAPTRERLEECLWDSWPSCLRYMPSIDPAVRRSIVIFREPRDVVLSGYKFRINVMRQQWVKELSVEDYIRKQFEVLVSWIHQRWVWHTSSVYAASSHVVYYEDFQESHLGFIDMAAFMGLECSSEQAIHVWNMHRNPSPHGNFATHPELHEETLEWMAATMARLLPPTLALRWGVTPIDLPPN